MDLETVAETPAAETGALERALGGDSQGFADLVREHQRMVYSIAWHFFQDPGLAEDLAQEVFVQLYHNLSAIKSEAHLVFWLRKVATRKCIDQARRRRHCRELDLEAAAHVSTEEKHADWLETEHLRRLVAALPARLRAVVTLRYQEDLEPARIAEVLGCPVNSVKSWLQRALALLRKRMGS